ncbi:MAG: single-stranded DNA-binding protein [bacterium]|nr:single-stranded DNA-binding protein [bacterium]
MASLNRVILLGNLTRDPELRFTPSGSPVSRFSIAINRIYTTTSGEKKEEVDFIPIVVWGKQAENCSQYLNKGSLVLVDGRLRQSSWETKEGEKRYAIEVIAQRVQFLNKPKGENRTTSTLSTSNEETMIGDEIDDEIPF